MAADKYPLHAKQVSEAIARSLITGCTVVLVVPPGVTLGIVRAVLATETTEKERLESVLGQETYEYNGWNESRRDRWSVQVVQSPEEERGGGVMWFYRMSGADDGTPQKAEG